MLIIIQEQKLDMENTRLRAELHALNKQCQKLRAERDSANESSYLATERATALEQVLILRNLTALRFKSNFVIEAEVVDSFLLVRKIDKTML